MTLWHASTELRLTAAGLAAASTVKSLHATKLGTVLEAGRILGRVAGRSLGLGLETSVELVADYCDTSG